MYFLLCACYYNPTRDGKNAVPGLISLHANLAQTNAHAYKQRLREIS